MPRPTSRFVAYVALALASFAVADGAKANVGDPSGALSSFGRSPLVQRVQAGECWNQNGPDGPGYYPCDNGVSGGSVVGPEIGRPDRHGIGRVNALPNAAPASPGLAGVHGPNEAAGAHVGAPASPGLTGAAGVHAPSEAARAHVGAPASPGVAAATPRIAAPASPGPVGVGAVHASGPAVAAVPHIAAPASPGLAGVHGVGGGAGVGGVGHR